MIFQILLLLFANVSLEKNTLNNYVLNTRPGLAVTRLQSVVEGINEGLSR